MAEYLAARGVHQATRGALSTVTDVRLLHDSLPRLLAEDPLAGESIPPTEYPDETFVRILLKEYAASRESVFTDIESSPDHRYRRLWERFPDIFSDYFTLQMTADNPPSPTEDRDEGIRITLEMAANLLIAAGAWYTINENPSPTPRELTDWALRNAHRLSWLSTVDRDSAISFFKEPFSSWLIDPQRIDILNSIFEGDEVVHGLLWTRRQLGLKQGPWPNARYCPGNLVLKPPDHDDQTLVNQLFTYTEERLGETLPGTNDGSFTQSRLMLTKGAYVAEHTIYARWGEYLSR